jgi:hypothetical protein
VADLPGEAGPEADLHAGEAGRADSGGRRQLGGSAPTAGRSRVSS